MYELTIYCKNLNSDYFSDSLLEYDGVLSVSLEDANSKNNAYPIFDEPGYNIVKNIIWDHVILHITINDNIDPYDLINYAVKKNNLYINSIEKFFLKKLDDRTDWVLEYQSNSKPININNKLFIISSWHNKKSLFNKFDYIKDNVNDYVIELDPGLAFGTGTHPTTYLCLSWMTDNNLKNSYFLDYGCGSGILSIAASKLGAKYITALDIDTQALESTYNNSLLNNTNIEIVNSYKNLNNKYDIIISNILANPLKDLSPIIDSLLLDNGKLVLTGILFNQTQEVIDVYSKWIKLSIWNQLDEWVCLHGQKY